MCVAPGGVSKNGHFRSFAWAIEATCMIKQIRAVLYSVKRIWNFYCNDITGQLDVFYLSIIIHMYIIHMCPLASLPNQVNNNFTRNVNVAKQVNKHLCDFSLTCSICVYSNIKSNFPLYNLIIRTRVNKTKRYNGR